MARANHPSVSRLPLSAMTPVRSTRPRVGFSPSVPQNAAGRMTDPAVWEPIATGTIASATAAADPLDEPPGVRAGSAGLRVGPGEK